MPDMTQEQLAAAETMSLPALRELAMKEAEAAVDTTEPVKTAENKPAASQARDADGKFTQADTLDNSADPDLIDGGEPTTTIYRKEIANGNGSVDVYEADSLEELVEKLAAAKLNANKKIQEFIAEKKTAVAKDTQISADDEYVIGEKLKKSPKQTMKEVVTEVIEERISKATRSEAVQSQFVATHPDYIADPENGKRIAAWVKTNGYSEFTNEGLEKAYQDLKASGLLKLKDVGADGVAEVKDKDIQQTVETKSETTQPRSQKSGSTISIRSGRTTPVKTNMQPTEDEAYQMPLDKLRELAEVQLAKAHNRD